MSLNDLMLTDVADVFMQDDDFASSILRYVNGDSGNIRSITGIVTLQEPYIDDMRGRGRIHKGQVDVAEATAIAANDAVLFANNRFEVESVSDPVHGMKTAQITRYEAEHAGRQLVKGLG